MFQKVFISYSCISYFGHADLKLNASPGHISLLTGKWATLTYVILVYGYVDILWIYQGTKIKMMTDLVVLL